MLRFWRSLLFPRFFQNIAWRPSSFLTMGQKIHALMTRRQPEARDVFDLYILSSRPEMSDLELVQTFSREELRQAVERTYSLDYERYRDTVVSFLRNEDQEVYDRSEVWDQIRLVAISLIESGLQDEG